MLFDAPPGEASKVANAKATELLEREFSLSTATGLKLDEALAVMLYLYPQVVKRYLVSHGKLTGANTVKLHESLTAFMEFILISSVTDEDLELNEKIAQEKGPGHTQPPHFNI